MRDGTIKECVAIVAIAGMYISYQVIHPESDGMIFASVVGAVGGLAGYSIAKKRLTRQIREG